ncbi:MAG: hypothetical protein J7527_08735, partial [Chitinophagaceae bacterium]|nr:hypothetical protein [Chitinophagaceae bacterium]
LLSIPASVHRKHLFIQDNIFLTALHLSKLILLRELNLGNRIVKLDLAGLEKIDGQNNNLETISFSQTPLIKHIDLKNNPIKITVDIRGLTNLEYPDLSGGQLLFLNFSGTLRFKTIFLVILRDLL